MTDPPASPPSLRRLLEGAASRGGVFTAAEARASGIPNRALQRLAARGLLVRQARGVYSSPSVRMGTRERAVLAVAGAGGVVSHQTAAELWGFELDTMGDVVHITRRRGAGPSLLAGVALHTSRRPPDSIVRAGVAVTRPARTLLDLASDTAVGDHQLRSFVDHCVQRRLASVRYFAGYVAEQGPGVAGVARCRHILADFCVVDSVAEAELMRVLAAAGIDPPVNQYEIRDAERFIARVDHAWPRRKVALEVDGFLYHSDFDTFVADRERGNAITTAGWVLLRTTPTAVRRRPEKLVATLRRVLGVGRESAA